MTKIKTIIKKLEVPEEGTVSDRVSFTTAMSLFSFLILVAISGLITISNLSRREDGHGHSGHSIIYVSRRSTLPTVLRDTDSDRYRGLVSCRIPHEYPGREAKRCVDAQLANKTALVERSLDA